MLIAVFFTEPINGATSWFDFKVFAFQPAEFAKIFVILLLAMVICKIQLKGKDELNKPLKLLAAIAVVAVPVLLIVKQPDYGTAAAYLVAMFLILLTAGIDKKYIIGCVIIIAVTVPIVYNFILPDHAKSRIKVYLNPDSDPRGARIQCNTI